MSKVFAVNHERKEIASVGNTTWCAEIGDMQKCLDIYAPRQQAARDQFQYSIDQFAPNELMLAEHAEALGYKRVQSFWDRGTA